MSLVEKLGFWIKDVPKSIGSVERSGREADIREILENQEFGVRQFNGFVKNMIRLAKPYDPLSSAGVGLDDKEANRDIAFSKTSPGEYKITVRTYPGRTSIGEAYSEELTYERSFTSGRKAEPYLSIHFSVSVPEDIKYSSYVYKKSIPLFLDGKYKERHVYILPDELAREFCGRVFGVYLQRQQESQSSSTSI